MASFGGIICDASSMHPYQCDGPGKCPHCDRRRLKDHNPKTCFLCHETLRRHPKGCRMCRRIGVKRV